MLAARRGAAAAWAAQAFHSSSAALSKSTPRFRFTVREKRGDAKSALKNLLLNGGTCQESSNKQMRKQKGGTGSKAQRSAPGKNPCGKNKRGHYWKSFDDDDECAHTPYGTYGGKKSFTWYWPGEDDGLGSNPSGFQWREESQSAKSKEKFWNESDVDEDEGSSRDDLRSYRISLGLPVLGPLKLDHIKAAFRASALKWHPDKHQGPSQAEAEEKFRRCVEAYNALTRAFRSSG
ncbi:uncharacterized protein LOC100285325 [Zea mays]|uniref:DnaJ domain containing protein n=1 Tax=Zea mays TaxID=4577 RepID=B6U3I3_MAIZE|nr:uncharacterized protein LOC100285325 [Zea mays]ACG43916.1 dnaJ domain containing protein [Zea mays]AQK79523.1 DnaJ domain containing protein [Zea mays]|eukprot:NP_001151690.1 uncharacterized protein LOC100285325 [Zea mays]